MQLNLSKDNGIRCKYSMLLNYFLIIIDVRSMNKRIKILLVTVFFTVKFYCQNLDENVESVCVRFYEYKLSSEIKRNKLILHKNQRTVQPQIGKKIHEVYSIIEFIIRALSL